MLSPAWRTAQPRVALAATLCLALVVGGAVFYAEALCLEYVGCRLSVVRFAFRRGPGRHLVNGAGARRGKRRATGGSRSRLAWPTRPCIFRGGGASRSHSPGSFAGGPGHGGTGARLSYAERALWRDFQFVGALRFAGARRHFARISRAFRLFESTAESTDSSDTALLGRRVCVSIGLAGL